MSNKWPEFKPPEHVVSQLSDISPQTLGDLTQFVGQQTTLQDVQGKLPASRIVGLTTVGYGTTLPASPTDTDEYILVDSITLPTYQWRFRYNAGSSNTDKWEFIGGSPAYAEVATVETAGTAGSYQALATAGPSIALPRAGVYQVAIGFRITTGGTTGGIMLMSYDIGGTGAVDADAVANNSTASSSWSVSRERQKSGLSAVTLTAKYKPVGTNNQYGDRWMRVTPVRVS